MENNDNSELKEQTTVNENTKNKGKAKYAGFMEKLKKRKRNKKKSENEIYQAEGQSLVTFLSKNINKIVRSSKGQVIADEDVDGLQKRMMDNINHNNENLMSLPNEEIIEKETESNNFLKDNNKVVTTNNNITSHNVNTNTNSNLLNNNNLGAHTQRLSCFNSNLNSNLNSQLVEDLMLMDKSGQQSERQKIKDFENELEKAFKEDEEEEAIPVSSKRESIIEKKKTDKKKSGTTKANTLLDEDELDFYVPKIIKTKRVYDSLSEEEEVKRSDLNLIPISFFSPGYKVYIFLRGFVMLLLLMHLVVILYNIAFDPFPERSRANLDSLNSYHNFIIFVDFIIVIEYISSLFVVYNSEDRLILKPSAIIKAFDREGILLDTLIAVPFTSIFIFSYFSEFDHYSKPLNHTILSHTRWIKILCIYRLNSAISKLNHYLDIWGNMDILTTFFNYGLYFHITSCLWIYTSKIEFLYNASGWIKYYFEDESQWKIYIASLYFNFTTLFTVGYGDLTAKTMYEYFFLVFLLIISVTVYSFLFSTISSHFSSTEKRSHMLEKKKEILDEISKASPVPETLNSKIMNYFNNSYNMNTENKNYLIDGLPAKIKYELLTNMYGDTVKSLKFFHQCKEDFSFFLLGQLKPFTLERKEMLLGVGCFFTDIIFVVKGQLDFFIASKNKHTRFYILKRGENFGEMCILNNEITDFKICASKKRDTELLLLSKENFLDLATSFPETFKAKVHEAFRRHQIMNKNKGTLLEKFTREMKEEADKNQKNMKDQFKDNETIIDSPITIKYPPSPFLSKDNPNQIRGSVCVTRRSLNGDNGMLELNLNPMSYRIEADGESEKHENKEEKIKEEIIKKTEITEASEKIKISEIYRTEEDFVDLKKNEDNEKLVKLLKELKGLSKSCKRLSQKHRRQKLLKEGKRPQVKKYNKKTIIIKKKDPISFLKKNYDEDRSNSHLDKLQAEDDGNGIKIVSSKSFGEDKLTPSQINAINNETLLQRKKYLKGYEKNGVQEELSEDLVQVILPEEAEQELELETKNSFHIDYNNLVINSIDQNKSLENITERTDNQNLSIKSKINLFKLSPNKNQDSSQPDSEYKNLKSKQKHKTGSIISLKKDFKERRKTRRPTTNIEVLTYTSVQKNRKESLFGSLSQTNKDSTVKENQVKLSLNSNVKPILIKFVDDQNNYTASLAKKSHEMKLNLSNLDSDRYAKQQSILKSPNKVPKSGRSNKTVQTITQSNSDDGIDNDISKEFDKAPSEKKSGKQSVMIHRSSAAYAEKMNVLSKVIVSKDSHEKITSADNIDNQISKIIQKKSTGIIDLGFLNSNSNNNSELGLLSDDTFKKNVNINNNENSLSLEVGNMLKMQLGNKASSNNIDKEVKERKKKTTILIPKSKQSHKQIKLMTKNTAEEGENKN